MFEYHIMESQSFKFTATTLSGDNAQQFELHWDKKEVHRYTKTSGEGFPRISEGSVVLFFGNFPYIDFLICSKNYADPRILHARESVPTELFLFQVSKSPMTSHVSMDNLLSRPGSFPEQGKDEEGKEEPFEHLALFLARKAGLADEKTPALDRLPDGVRAVYMTTYSEDYPRTVRRVDILLVKRRNLLRSTNLDWNRLRPIFNMLDRDDPF